MSEIVFNFFALTFDFYLLFLSDDGYCLPALQQPISLAEIAKLEVADRVDIASVDDTVLKVAEATAPPPPYAPCG